MNLHVELRNFLLDLFAELQICSLRFGLLLTSDPEEILVNERVDVALEIDLLLDFVHCLVKFFGVNFDAENALLKLGNCQKTLNFTYQDSLHLVHSENRCNGADLLLDIHEDRGGWVYEQWLVKRAGSLTDLNLVPVLRTLNFSQKHLERD